MMKKVLSFLCMYLMVSAAYAQTCPDDNHPHVIDLGLPSGTKWACCNVGTDKPEGYGELYAWGETEPKTIYSWSNYTHCDGTSDTCHDLGEDIAGTEYDVAHVKWGGSWVMPTSEQQVELLSKSPTSQWTTVNGVQGRLFYGWNGNTLFLPAAGYIWNDDHYGFDSSGDYWSSTHHPSEGSENASGFTFSSEGRFWFEGLRIIGQTVRPVYDETTSINLPESSSNKASKAIYNLYGIKVADNSSDLNTLSPGIYIVNGKKMVVR